MHVSPDVGNGKSTKVGECQRKAALQYAARYHCLVEEWHDCEEFMPKPKEKLIHMEKKLKAEKHRTEWCAAASKYRCTRCGRKKS